jgi:hypothetical protein
MPILSTEQSIKIARAREDAKVQQATYAIQMTTSLITAAGKANLFEKFYDLIYRSEEPTFILATLKRNDMWNNHPIEASKALENFPIMEQLQEECGECIHASWDYDENSEIINVYLTFIPPKQVNSPEAETEERRHQRITSW